MTQSRDEPAATHRTDLVEPEGVNAGSDRIGRHRARGDVLSGGRPEVAPSPDDAVADAADGSGDLTGAPRDDPREPGGPDAESGQDAGLMQ